MFTTVAIDNFRGFGKLHLEGLGRVNLVVGKNNTGKTSLLEAITLLSNTESIGKLPGLFRANAGLVEERFYRWLIKDRAGRDGAEANDSVERLGATLRATWEDGTSSQLDLTPSPPPQNGSAQFEWTNNALWLTSSASETPRKLTFHAVSVQHRGPESIVDAFAEAVRSPIDEKQMEALLASVDARIKSVRLDAVHSKPFIVVDVGLSNRVPLSQAGQGIYRLVAIFSELLGNKPNLCFIDEIENGIHYTALPAVWRGIAEVAGRLDIQVFATTHSRECMLAAHEAFAARSSYDLRVVQLYRLGDGTTGRVLDRAHIEAAVTGDIEVR